jgi:hypothetical protein
VKKLAGGGGGVVESDGEEEREGGIVGPERRPLCACGHVSDSFFSLSLLRLCPRLCPAGVPASELSRALSLGVSDGAPDPRVTRAWRLFSFAVCRPQARSRRTSPALHTTHLLAVLLT